MLMKLKTLVSNTKIPRYVHPSEDKVLLHGDSDFEEKIDQLVRTTVREQFEGKMERFFSQVYHIRTDRQNSKHRVGKYCLQCNN